MIHPVPAPLWLAEFDLSRTDTSRNAMEHETKYEAAGSNSARLISSLARPIEAFALAKNKRPSPRLAPPAGVASGTASTYFYAFYSVD